MAEQKQEMVARGEGAQQLEPNLVELPGRCAAWVCAGAAGARGSSLRVQVVAPALLMEPH